MVNYRYPPHPKMGRARVDEFSSFPIKRLDRLADGWLVVEAGPMVGRLVGEMDGWMGVEDGRLPY